MYAVTGRIEKGYRLMGAELESEYNPVEAGLARPKVKSADFMGKDAYMKAREEAPAAIMCTLSMDSQRCADGYDRFPTGGNEPILTLDGERILDAKGRVSRVTTAGAGPSVGKYLLLAYLPPEHAVEGTKLQVMYMNELLPGHRRARRLHAVVRSRRHTNEVMRDPRLREACAGTRRAHQHHRRRSGDRHRVSSASR